MAKPVKRNKVKKISPILENPVSSNQPVQVPAPIGSKSFISFFVSWISTLLFACAIFFAFKNRLHLAIVLGAVALIFQVLKISYEKKFFWLGNIFSTIYSRLFTVNNSVFFLLLFWLAFSAFVLTFPSYNWLLPEIQKYVPFQQSFWVPIILFIGMVILFRQGPDRAKDSSQDISSWTARFWLLVSLGLGAYLRFYHFSTPPLCFWDDNVYYITAARNVADLDNYRGNFIFQNGVLPVVPYFSVFLWHLFPDLTTLTMERLTGTIFDLGAIWALYLAGKEIGGRRMGVLAAALAAIDKALIQKCYTGYTEHSVVALSLALAILFTVRVMKKPDLRHFLQWGMIVGFGEYTTSQFTPFVPFFLFLILGWLFFQRPSPGQASPGLMVGITAAVLLFYYLYYCGALPDGNYFSKLIDFAGSWMPCMVLAAVLVLASLYFPKMAINQKNEKWIGWISASWICTVLAFPIMTNDIIFLRIKGEILNPGHGLLNGSFVINFFKRLVQTFDGLFAGAGDRSDMSLNMDAFFGYPEAILIALGLAFCLARPTQKRILIFLLMIMGFVPYNVAGAPHSGYLVGSITPFLLIAALGLNELLISFFQAIKNRLFQGLVLAALLGFWIWAAQGVFSRVYDQFGKHAAGVNGFVYTAAMEDINLGYRVYFDPDTLLTPTTYVLYEGHHVYPWYKNTPNVIFLNPKENLPNIVVYAWPPATELKARIQKAYPSAQWSEVHVPQQNDGMGLRCFIPSAAVSGQLSMTPEQLKRNSFPIEFRQAAEPSWDRQYINTGAGLVFTSPTWEDKTSNINDPLPPNMFFSPPGARYTGGIHINREGEYEITCKTSERTEICIDGKKIFDLFFSNLGNGETGEKNVKKDIDLKSGDHQVEVTCVLLTPSAPEVTLSPKGTPGKGQSLWTSFNF